MYWKDTYEFLNSNDIEYKWEGKYGAKGEKRQKKKKATPEQIKKQNQWKKEREVWRKIRWNFYEGDLWTTLTFPEGTRMSLQKIKKIMTNFWQNMRRAYKKRGKQLLWIMRIEIGKKGGNIMRYRYIDGMTWRETAKKLGPGNSEDAVRMEIKRFLKQT